MELVLHEATRQALAQLGRRPAGSYVFYGPESVGKYAAALETARSLNCAGPHPATQPCASCAQFRAGAHPDLITIAPEDKPSVTIEQIRRLASALTMQPYYQTSLRTVIIDSADTMTIDAANALLKLLEEPPPRTLFLLIAPATETLLPTVRSRLAAISFPLPPHDQVVNLLQTRHNLKPTDAERLTDAAEGAPGTALRLAADPAAAATRLELAGQATAALSQSRFERLRIAAKLAAANANLPRFARLLHYDVTDSLTAQAMPPLRAAIALTALEQFRRQLAAKVAPRVALERLMLELP